MKKLVSLLLTLCIVMGFAAMAMAEGKDTLTVAASAEAKKFFASGKDGSNNNDYAVVLNNLYNTWWY
jgi:uncharacterized protein (UPF0333 family)